MKTIRLLFGGLLSAFTCFAQLGIAPGILPSGFAPNGAFQLHVNSGPLQIEYSSDLNNWTTLTSGSDRIADEGSTNAPWRFYRAKKGTAFTSNVVGYVHIMIEPGKMAVLASPFKATLHLDRPSVRKIILGSENPSVQISLSSEGKMTAYTFDELDNKFTPEIPPIAWGTGFMVRNTGKAPLHVTLGGELPLGELKRQGPKAEGLVGPLVPKPGPVHEAFGVTGVEGSQILVWNEAKQSYQTNSFNAQTGRWIPPLDYKPGRGVILKGSHPTLQAHFSPIH